MRTLICAAILCFIAMSASARAEDMSFTISDAKNAEAGSGKVSEVHDGLLYHVELQNMTPGWHAVHVHGMGDCSDGAAGFKAAGSHAMHENDEKHGFMNSDDVHFGDLPNLWVGADGKGAAEFFKDDARLADLKDKDGSAFMVHARPDDYKTQPAGDAGDRVACGIIAPKQADAPH